MDLKTLKQLPQRLNNREKVIAVLVGYVLVYMIFELGFNAPLVEKSDAVQQKVASVERKIEENYAFMANPDIMRNEIADAQQMLDRYTGRLGRAGESGAFISELAALCERFNVEIITLRPTARKMQKYDFNQVTIRLDLRCDFKTMACFFSALKELETATMVNALDIRRADAYPRLECSVVLETLFPLEPPAAA